MTPPLIMGIHWFILTQIQLLRVYRGIYSHKGYLSKETGPLKKSRAWAENAAV